MNKEQLKELSDEELRSAFRKHNMQGIVISLSLLVIFMVIYLVPLGISPELMYYLFIGLIALSASFALWFNFSKRKYFREFRARKTHY